LKTELGRIPNPRLYRL